MGKAKTQSVCIRRVARGIWFVVVLLSASCATGGPSQPYYGLEKRIYELERRIAVLESRYEHPAPIPHQSKNELQKQLDASRKEREKLSLSYTDKHPRVMELDRKIRALEQQIKVLQQRPATAAEPN